MSKRTTYSGRHRVMTTPSKTGAALRRGTTGVVLATALSVGLGSGMASAVPEQGGVTSPPEQDGVTSTPEQDGVTSPDPTPTPEPYNPGPGLVPSPPDTGDWQPAPPSGPTVYEDTYNPTPSEPLHAPEPTAPVPRIAPPPNTLRVGNVVVPIEDIPDFPNKTKAIRSTNEWSAYAEAEIARGLISIGVPKDEASRKAAATIIGVVAGGAIGGSVAFTATTLTVGVVSVPLGAVIGGVIGASTAGFMPEVPWFVPNTVGGAAIGAAAGAAVAVGTGALAGATGAAVGGVIGGLIAYGLGAGDPGASTDRPGDVPWAPGGDGGETAPPPLPNPGANQFEFHLPAPAAKKAGLPAVDYVVNNRGDVSVKANAFGQQYNFGWSAEVAQAPINALGPLAPAAKKAINDATRTRTGQAEKDIPGAHADWPQEKAPAESAPRP